MTRLRISGTLIMLLLFAGTIILNAQTFHKDLHYTIDNEYVMCLNKQVTGTWTYRISYHVDKKTGMLSNVHWNVLQSDIWDEDGVHYKYIDTGNETLGNPGFSMWDLWNNIIAYNEGYGVYIEGVEDGWLNDYIPDPRPAEGKLINTFKVIGGGETFTWTWFWVVKVDKCGELKFELYKEYMDCN